MEEVLSYSKYNYIICLRNIFALDLDEFILTHVLQVSLEWALFKSLEVQIEQ